MLSSLEMVSTYKAVLDQEYIRGGWQIEVEEKESDSDNNVFKMIKAFRWRPHLCINKDRSGYAIIKDNSQMLAACTKKYVLLTLTKKI